MNNEYEFSITKVNYVINSLPLDARQKIPENVVKFFNNNSNPELLSQDIKTQDILSSSFDENDFKFLKIIDYYINGK